jgi:hypothetical protein
MNTKQFAKMREKELATWWKERTSGNNAKLPFLPCEPVAYFDMEEKLEL